MGLGEKDGGRGVRTSCYKAVKGLSASVQLSKLLEETGQADKSMKSVSEKKNL